MGLLINQGKQKIQSGGMSPIESPNTQLSVEKLEIDKYSPNSLRVSMRILDGNYRNNIVYDTVCYDPSSALAWKYQAFRAACGVPYTEDEPVQIDVETLVLNRVLTADLSIRKYTAKDGTEKEAQNFKYKAYKVTSATTSAQINTNTQTIAASNIQSISIDDDDLPFKSAVVEKQPQIKAEEKTSETKVESTPQQNTMEEPKASVNSSYDDWD